MPAIAFVRRGEERLRRWGFLGGTAEHSRAERSLGSRRAYTNGMCDAMFQAACLFYANNAVFR